MVATTCCLNGLNPLRGLLCHCPCCCHSVRRAPHLRKRIEGGRAIFDVTIPKPLGVTPKDFPNRPGVGIAGIKKGGEFEKHKKRLLLTTHGVPTIS